MSEGARDARQPAGGRIFSRRLRPGIADTDSTGEVRLDAIARWLQDIAYLDVVDAGFEHRGAWIVRRTRIRARALPRFGEDLVVRTFCSGMGRFCAERTTTVEGTTASVEAVAVWVHLDPGRRTPARFDGAFRSVYAESAAGRTASPRLGHPAPPAGAEPSPWEFRSTDLDLAGHVNNSHYWAILEACLREGHGERRRWGGPGAIGAEVEHHAAAGEGTARVLRSEEGIWVTTTAGEVLASIAPLPAQQGGPGTGRGPRGGIAR
ncbi:MAG: thioesterase [Solirubrobacterales bacterium]